jgi:hypothetical protein
MQEKYVRERYHQKAMKFHQPESKHTYKKEEKEQGKCVNCGKLYADRLYDNCECLLC